MFQTRNMPNARFQPTISRNRLTTNWVAASSVASAPSRTTKRKLWIFGILALGLLALLWILPVIRASVTEPRAIKPNPYASLQSFRTTQPTSPLPLCSEEDLMRRFESLTKVSTIDLGGVRVSRVDCENQSYVASERRNTKGWQLNEISRSPSGDREISMDY